MVILGNSKTRMTDLRSRLCCGHVNTKGWQEGKCRKPASACSLCQARVPWAAVPQEKASFSVGLPRGEKRGNSPAVLSVQKCLECFQPGVWTTVRRERERLGYAGRAARQAPSVWALSNNEKLIGYKCVYVCWWTDLHFEKITLVAAWKTD